MTARSLAEQALELAGKATPGPWKWDSETLRGKDRSAVFHPTAHKTVRDRLNHEVDGEFIAFAREALPALAERCLALEEALREQQEHLSAALEIAERLEKRDETIDTGTLVCHLRVLNEDAALAAEEPA